jgi:hypothetical protein
VAALATDGNTSPTPTPLRIMPGRKRVTNSGVAVNVNRHAIAAANKTAPVAIR